MIQGCQVEEPLPKLSEVLFQRPKRDFGSMAALPSNIQAVEAGLRFATGGNRFVALIGPTGWGKSHLMEAVASCIAQTSYVLPEIHSCVDWVLDSQPGDNATTLLLDNVQDALERPRIRQKLRLALERRVRGGRRTMVSFTAPKCARSIRSFLPSARDWTVVTIGLPVPAERLLVVKQMAASEGLELSPTLAGLIADRMRGNGRTIAGALKRLRLHGLIWLDARTTIRALGVLNPFFSDDSSWDLEGCIEQGVTSTTLRAPELRDGMAAFVMLREACLCEASVAARFGIQPAAAYQRSAQFAKRLEKDRETRVALDQAVELAVRNIVHD